MPITYHESNQTFHIYNNHISYIIQILKSGHLGQLYYGKAVKDHDHFDHLFESIQRATSVCTFDNDLTYSLEHIKQEYPTYGSGDFHYPAIDILQENGSRILNFTYNGHIIIKGKQHLDGLPATFVENNFEATTLLIYLYDNVIKTRITLIYTLFEYLPVITRSAKIENLGNQMLKINSMMSLSLDLPDYQYNMIELTGAWSREMHIKERKLQIGVQSIHSLKGTSSHSYNPFLALKRPNCTETSGEVLGFSFVYSGNFLAQVEVDPYNVSRITIGINPFCFEWNLGKGQSFQTPEVVMVYSDEGLNGMSHAFHNLYRKHLLRGNYRNKSRPILVNNWEGTQWDFNEEIILDIAKVAKDVGIELFVLDDGWFGDRNDDKTSLGDWYPNLKKLPNGISGLSKKINNLGLDFGIWIEPEMISKNSHLYQIHPEYTLKTPHRHTSHGRNQYVLDFSNCEVVDYIYNCLIKIIDDSHISYIKWDMNRCMSEVYSSVHDSAYQGQIMHEYILGVYNLYERLISKYPHILFESCASGGARFDPGMLYYAPQTWASDNTDAIERLKIQYGASLVYPITCIGSHVSEIPNHAVFRNTPLHTRANVAYFGTFGYEVNLTKMSTYELEIIKKQISFMKQYRELIQLGDFYRLLSPFESNETAWIVVSKDKEIAIVGYYRTLQEVNVGYRRLKLVGLDANKNYTISNNYYECYGDELMNIGLITSDASCGENNIQEGDYVSRLYIIKEKKQ